MSLSYQNYTKTQMRRDEVVSLQRFPHCSENPSPSFLISFSAPSICSFPFSFRFLQLQESLSFSTPQRFSSFLDGCFTQMAFSRLSSPYHKTEQQQVFKASQIANLTLSFQCFPSFLSLSTRFPYTPTLPLFCSQSFSHHHRPCSLSSLTPSRFLPLSIAPLHLTLSHLRTFTLCFPSSSLFLSSLDHSQNQLFFLSTRIALPPQSALGSLRCECVRCPSLLWVQSRTSPISPHHPVFSLSPFSYSVMLRPSLCSCSRFYSPSLLRFLSSSPSFKPHSLVPLHLTLSHLSLLRFLSLHSTPSLQIFFSVLLVHSIRPVILSHSRPLILLPFAPSMLHALAPLHSRSSLTRVLSLALYLILLRLAFQNLFPVS